MGAPPRGKVRIPQLDQSIPKLSRYPGVPIVYRGPASGEPSASRVVHLGDPDPREGSGLSTMSGPPAGSVGSSGGSIIPAGWGLQPRCTSRSPQGCSVPKQDRCTS